MNVSRVQRVEERKEKRVETWNVSMMSGGISERTPTSGPGGPAAPAAPSFPAGPCGERNKSGKKHQGKRSSRALSQQHSTSIPWVADVGETAEGREWKIGERGERLVESGERP